MPRSPIGGTTLGGGSRQAVADPISPPNRGGWSNPKKRRNWPSYLYTRQASRGYRVKEVICTVFGRARWVSQALDRSDPRPIAACSCRAIHVRPAHAARLNSCALRRTEDSLIRSQDGATICAQSTDPIVSLRIEIAKKRFRAPDFKFN